jgi:hypothetical protein
MVARGKDPEGLGFVSGALAAVVGLFVLLFFLLREDTESKLVAAGNVAQVVNLVSVVVAVGALLYARRQVTIAREIQAENFESMRDQQVRNFAEGLYRDYLKLAFENPVLAYPNGELEAFDYEEHTIGGKREAYVKYIWFLSFVLDTCELLYQQPLRQEYRETVLTQLGHHRVWLGRQWKKWELNQSGFLTQFRHNAEYLELIREVVEKNAFGNVEAAAKEFGTVI